MRHYIYALACFAALGSHALAEDAPAPAPAAGEEVAKTNHIVNTNPAEPAPQPQNSTPIPDKQSPLKPAEEDKTPISASLLDGTEAVFYPDGKIKVKGTDGKEHTPPNGVLTLRDGTTFAVEHGVRVQQ